MLLVFSKKTEWMENGDVTSGLDYSLAKCGDDINRTGLPDADWLMVDKSTTDSN
jgi:hypothetical protein